MQKSNSEIDSFGELEILTKPAIEKKETEKSKRRHRGSISKRGKKSWRCKVESDSIDGKRQYITHTIVGPKEMAEEWIQNYHQEKRGGNRVLDPKITYGEYSLEAINSFLLPRDSNDEEGMTEKTRERFEQLNRIHVLPHFRNIKLQDLSRSDLKKLYSDLRREGKLSSTTIKHVHRTISRILSEAVEDGKLVVNVCSRFKFKTKTSINITNDKKLKFLDVGQKNSFLASIENDDSYPIIFIALATGARRGELLALRWADVDFDKKFIRVSRAVEETTLYGLRFKIPKTPKSRRNISICDESVKILKRIKLKQNEWCLKAGRPLPDQALVFPKSLNSPCDIMSPHNITRRFNVLAKREGFEGLTFHALRHTHATLLLSGGAKLHAVSKRLGHSTPMLTMNIYGHPVSGDDDEAAAIAANFMSNVSKGNT